MDPPRTNDTAVAQETAFRPSEFDYFEPDIIILPRAIPLRIDVIVEIDPRAPPFRELPIVGRQGDESVALDLFEQLASAQTEVAHGTIVHALHDERDRLVAFDEREEGQPTQRPKNVDLGESPAFDLRLVQRLPSRAGRTPTESCAAMAP